MHDGAEEDKNIAVILLCLWHITKGVCITGVRVKRENLFKRDYDSPIEIAEGIYWVGFYDKQSGLHCNPYLIIDNDEAVLIDGGSRTDFSTVMLKILQTGIDPKKIIRLIYQHYDPDLCGSIPHFEDIISSPMLKLISHRENNVFIKYYSVKSPMQCIEAMDYTFEFSSGRKLLFKRTPYSHSAGSFVTLDEKTGTLFSSDIFGSYRKQWSLFLDLPDECRSCETVNSDSCPDSGIECPVKGISDFHRRIMPSCSSLKYAMDVVENMDFRMIAPQHGSIIHSKRDIEFFIRMLSGLKEVGIDGFKTGEK